MKILEHRLLNELSPAKVQYIRIDPEDISVTLVDILKFLMDLSWLKNFDEEYEQRAFNSKAQKTVDDIKEKFAKCSDKKLKSYPLVSTKTYAKDVDYDLIVYDTYDYLDKLIGFKLSDIFYAMFHQYYKVTNDSRAEKLAKYFKYGTDKKDEIWMLRYGFTFDDIEWVEPYIDSIDENEIVFSDKIAELDDIKSKVIEKYIYK